MKRQQPTFVALAFLLGSLTGWAATDDVPAITDPSVQPATPTPAVVAIGTSTISGPVRDVLKMATSGVPDDVLRAYIQNSSSTFNLTPDGIIQLQGAGVSTAVTSAMMAHDKAIIDQATQFPPATQAPQPQPMPPPSTLQSAEETPPNVDVSTIGSEPNPYTGSYSDLAPYGSWYNVGGYGWGWQPYSWLAYSGYPWGFPVLATGRWWHHPLRGWFWCPGGVGASFRSGGGVASSAAFVRPSVSQPFIIHNSSTFIRSGSAVRSFTPAGMTRWHSTTWSGNGSSHH
jgi:hypothetical protein